MKRDGVLFRGTRDGVLVVFDDQADYETVKNRLIERLEESRAFFQGHRVVLDTGSRTLGPAELVELEWILSSRFGIHLDKVVHGHEGQKAAELDRQPSTAEKQPAVELDERKTLLVKRTLRSGQRVGFDGNVVVLGDVNPGSEVLAAGDVVVMGALRGVVHAGASGDERAVVAALRLAPTQLRIADRISRPPEGAATGPGRPEIARLSDDGIVVEAMSWIAGG